MIIALLVRVQILMDIWHIVDIYNRIPYSKDNSNLLSQATTRVNLCEHTIQWKKPDTKNYALNNSVSIDFKHWLNKTMVIEVMRSDYFGEVACMGRECGEASWVLVNVLFLHLVDSEVRRLCWLCINSSHWVVNIFVLFCMCITLQ